jgi:7-cyano-7-deazaguanine synthase
VNGQFIQQLSNMPSRTLPPIGVLLGGGIESTAVVKRLMDDGRIVVPVRINCGLVWDAAESHHTRRFCAAQQTDRLRPLIEIELGLQGLLGQHWAATGRGIPLAGASSADLEIPLRNLTLISLAVRKLMEVLAIDLAAAGDDSALELAIGTTADNCYRDGSREYFDRCEDVLSLEAGRPVVIVTPFLHLRKPQIIRDTDPATLALSFSCVSPFEAVPCGRCIKCGRRQVAFREAGVPDPTEYAS